MLDTLESVKVCARHFLVLENSRVLHTVGGTSLCWTFSNPVFAQNDVSDPETVRYLSLDVVSQRETVIFVVKRRSNRLNGKVVLPNYCALCSPQQAVLCAFGARFWTRAIFWRYLQHLEELYPYALLQLLLCPPQMHHLPMLTFHQSRS